MSAGRGISPEVSTAPTSALHGAQLWVALPDAAHHGAPSFEHHAPDPVLGAGYQARVFLGSLLGETSPVPTATPQHGAELLLEAGAAVRLVVDPDFELGVLVDHGDLLVAGTSTVAHDLVYVPPGEPGLDLVAGVEPVRPLLSGPPFGESLVMGWNFVARTHDEMVEARQAWQSPITPDGLVDGTFGRPVGESLGPIPAPELPGVRLKERR